ncbi:MAG: toll/interleukin-1 receptor domain-containing protein [Chloroflexi bacterium]|nr:toll/interleukin-1 receptor domain-containing protein [Chloroflexota bacterium]
MPRIFISYRRADSRTITGRIYDRLVYAFGADNVFKDVDDIPLGSDFREVIHDAVAKTDVLMVIIGPQWATLTDQKGRRRLDDPDDFVRIEVEAGLRRDNPVVVIPVLVGGAVMPTDADLPDSLDPLVFRNAAMVREDPDFNSDMARLIDQLKRDFPEPTPAMTPKTQRRSGVPNTAAGWLLPGVLVVIGVVVLALILLLSGGDKKDTVRNDTATPPILNPSPNAEGVLCTVVNLRTFPILLRQGPAVTYDRVGTLEPNEVGYVIDQDISPDTGKVWMLVYINREGGPLEGYLKGDQPTEQTTCPPLE